MKIYRMPMEALPGIYAEYLMKDGQRAFIGVVSPHGDPLNQALGAMLMPDGRCSVLDFIRNLVCAQSTSTPHTRLADRLLDPEDLGFQATAEIRDAARRALGIEPVETVKAVIRSDNT